MKLKVPDWKQAWFENHISDRFFQEMGKLEKGTTKGLESTAQWTEQVMIDVGQLAQAMIRLESESAGEPQVRHAFDKALRLAALSLHLMTALSGMQRSDLRAGGPAAGSGYAPGPAAGPQPILPRPTAPPAADATPAVQGAPSAPGPQPPFLPPFLRPQPVSAPEPPAEAPAPTALPAQAAADGMPEAPAQPDAPLFSEMLQVSGQASNRSESHAHQTILSLSSQGLSRAEIEMVTGEPRHVIEAVLNHSRSKQPPSAQSTG